MMTANELNEIYQAELEVLAASAGAIRHMLAETRRRPPGDVDAGPAGLGVVRPAPAPPQHYSLHEAAVHQLRADGWRAAWQLAARSGRGGRHALLRRHRLGRGLGGEPDAMVVACDKATGAEAWRALDTNSEAGYSLHYRSND